MNDNWINGATNMRERAALLLEELSKKHDQMISGKSPEADAENEALAEECQEAADAIRDLPIGQPGTL